MEDLKRLAKAVMSSTPKKDTVGTGHLVQPEVVRAELQEIREKTAFLRRIVKYKNIDDLFGRFSLDAARQLCFEMKYARSSKDRQSAAKEIIHMHVGTPMHRTMNLNAEIGAKTDKELDRDIDQAIRELGFSRKEGSTPQGIAAPKTTEGKEPTPESETA